jgi:DNA-binding MarR family transcriptional regulator
MIVRSPERGRCNCTSLRKASRRLSQLYDSHLAPCGLRSTQFSILSEISRRETEAPTIAELAGALAMDASTVGQNLKPLERDGLVSVDADHDDRRRRNVRLTRTGQRLFAEAVPLWARAQAQFEQSFGDEDAVELRALLLRIVSAEDLTTLAT